MVALSCPKNIVEGLYKHLRNPQVFNGPYICMKEIQFYYGLNFYYDSTKTLKNRRLGYSNGN